MRLAKLTVVALFLLGRMCRAKIVIPTPNPDESTPTLAQGLVNILTTCYRDRIRSGIGLAGNLSETLLRTLSSQHLIPLTLFDPGDPSDLPSEPRHVPVPFRRKLQVFVVEAFFWISLDDIIETMKSSIWWNHMASFFILDGSPNCDYVEDYLVVAWDWNVLDAKVMCHGTNATIVVSYNPFTSVAPDSWRRVNVFPGLYAHPFTTFLREYTGNESICVDLDYDKTKDLGGYPIRLQGLPPSVDMESSKERPNVYKFLSTHVRILRTINRAMNSTPEFSGRFTTDLPDTKDMATNSHWMAFTWRDILITYPHEQTGLVLISQFRGHKSQLDKIFSIVDVHSRYGFAVVFFITLIFFKFVAGQDFVRALLNLTRITSGTGFRDLPVNTSSRIYLTGLLFFAVTILGIFQSGLASLLTKKIPLRNVDTVKDLVNFGYNVSGGPNFKYLIELPDVEKRYVDTDDIKDCIMHVRREPSAACISFAQASALDLARRYNLHVSSRFVVPTYIGFPIRWDWALEERVNIILAKMVEADVLQRWDVQCNPMKLSDFQFDEEVKKNTTHKVLELSELLFAFVILSIGLACATIVFFVELAVRGFQTRNVDVRIQILN